MCCQDEDGEREGAVRVSVEYLQAWPQSCRSVLVCWPSCSFSRRCSSQQCESRVSVRCEVCLCPVVVSRCELRRHIGLVCCIMFTHHTEVKGHQGP